MIFSVYDYSRRCFDYYEAPGTSKTYGVRGTKYRALNQAPQGPRSSALSGGRGIGLVGFAPEALAMKLPSSARKVGSGTEARGVIAAAIQPAYPSRWEEQGGTLSGGLAGLGDDDATVPTPVVTHTGVPFSQVVAAACIASVVGVIVQRFLTGKLGK